MSFLVHKKNIIHWPLLRDLDEKVLPKVKSFAYHHKRLYCITNEKRVIVFGDNRDGLLAAGRLNDLLRPETILKFNNENVVEIVCGARHVMARTESGRLWGWGDNDWGQVGIGDTDKCDTPQIIIDKDITSVKCGVTITIALNRMGKAMVFGVHLLRPVELDFEGKRIGQIECGAEHALALSVDGDVYGYVDYNKGQMEHSGTYLSRCLRKLSRGSDKYKLIGCGTYSSIMLTVDNVLTTTTNNKTTTVKLNISIEKILTVNYGLFDGGLETSLYVAVTKGSEVYVWGDTRCGQRYQPTKSGDSVPETLTAYSKTLACPVMLDYSNVSPLDYTEKFSGLFDSPELSDIKFTFPGGETIYGHRVLLGLNSNYLKVQMSDVWCQSSTVPISIYPYPVYYKYIKFIYTGLLESDSLEQTIALLELANCLLEFKLESLCSESILLHHLNIYTCAHLFTVANQYNWSKLAEDIAIFMCQHFVQIAQANCFREMDVENFIKFNSHMAKYCLDNKNLTVDIALCK